VHVDPSAIVNLIAAFVVLAAALVPVFLKKGESRARLFLKKIHFLIEHSS
jgi:hypothetical protein